MPGNKQKGRRASEPKGGRSVLSCEGDDDGRRGNYPMLRSTSKAKEVGKRRAEALKEGRGKQVYLGSTKETLFFCASLQGARHRVKRVHCRALKKAMENFP